MKKIALILFILVSIGELLSIVLGVDWLHQICKPLIMIALGCYYLISTTRESRSILVIGAIIFSLAGDVFLMFPEHFISGLMAFLISHLLYIFSYRQHQGEQRENSLLGVQRIRLAFPIILAGTGLLIILYPSLGDLKASVTTYTAVLCLMVLAALFRFGRTTTESFWMVFSGAILFMISDSILAIDKFLMPIKHNSLLIMATYISAQFLIIKGLLKAQRRIKITRL